MVREGRRKGRRREWQKGEKEYERKADAGGDEWRCEKERQGEATAGSERECAQVVREKKIFPPLKFSLLSFSAM
eukprot:538046-Hanusia_phi.AAC.1